MSKEVAVIDAKSTTAEIGSGLQQYHNDTVMTAALGAMFAMPKENFVSLTGEYFTMLPRQNYKIAVTGITAINFEEADKEPIFTDCVEFKMFDPATMKKAKDGTMTGELKNYVCGAAVLVSTVKREYEKEEKAGRFGVIMGFDINTLDEVKKGPGKYVNMQIGRLFAPGN